ncbi:MAG TPA: RDD family protein [Trebonia sp.]|nr:RDD family protein [Trebonia sp.]
MAEIVTGEAVVLDLPYARFPTRMLAHLIDMFVQFAAMGVVGILALGGLATGALNGASLAAVLVTGFVAAIVGYPIACETLSRGRTPGKAALGLRVVAEDGGPVRFRQALVRALAGSVECWLMFGVPALVTAMISARGNRLGDIFAGTFVIRERAPRAASGPYPAGGYAGRAGGPSAMDPALSGWAATLDLSALPEPVATAAGSYLSRYWQLNPAARDQLGGQLAASVSAHVTPPPPPGLHPAAYLHAVLAEHGNRELARLQAGRGPAWQAGYGPACQAAVAQAPVTQPAPPPPSDDGGFAVPR